MALVRWLCLLLCSDFSNRELVRVLMLMGPGRPWRVGGAAFYRGHLRSDSWRTERRRASAKRDRFVVRELVRGWDSLWNHALGMPHHALA